MINLFKADTIIANMKIEIIIIIQIKIEEIILKEKLFKIVTLTLVTISTPIPTPIPIPVTKIQTLLLL
jgi:hypothetical protein